MRAPDRLPPETRQRLGERRARAEQARAALVRDLAGRSLAHLAAMPAQTWDRLGAQGVVALIRAHRDLAHLRLPPPAGGLKAKPAAGGLVAGIRERVVHWRAVRPLPVVTAVALMRGSVFAILLAMAVLPARELVTQAGGLDRAVSCPRLDRWTGGCVYTLRADGLSLERVALALGRPPDDLAAANPTVAPGRLLRRGARIVIPLHPFLKIAR